MASSVAEKLREASQKIQEAKQIASVPVEGSGAQFPNFPPGTVGIQIPENARMEIVDGNLILRASDGSIITGPYKTYDLSNDYGQGYANMMGASAEGQSVLMITPDGKLVGMAQGSAEAYLLDAKYEGSYGPLDVYANAYIGANANGSAGFQFDPDALTLEAQAEFYLGVEAYIEAGGTVDLGALGELYADGYARAEASLSASGELYVNLREGEFQAAGEFDAMAGVSAGLTAGYEGALGSAEASFEAYAGVGVSGHADIGFKDGVFSFDLGFAAALGIGFGANIKFDIDFKEIGKKIKKAAKKIIEAPKKIIKGIGKGIKKIGKGIKKLFGW